MAECMVHAELLPMDTGFDGRQITRMVDLDKSSQSTGFLVTDILLYAVCLFYDLWMLNSDMISARLDSQGDPPTSGSVPLVARSMTDTNNVSSQGRSMSPINVHREFFFNSKSHLDLSSRRFWKIPAFRSWVSAVCATWHWRFWSASAYEPDILIMANCCPMRGVGCLFVHVHLTSSAWVSSVRNHGGQCEVSHVTSDSSSQSCVPVSQPSCACNNAIIVVSLSSQVKLCPVSRFTVAHQVHKWLRGAFGVLFPWASGVEVASGDEAAFSANKWYYDATTPVYGSGTMYIIRPRAISLPLAWVSRGSGAHTTSRPSSTKANTKRPSPSSREGYPGLHNVWRAVSRLWPRNWASPSTPVSRLTMMRMALIRRRERERERFGSWNWTRILVVLCRAVLCMAGSALRQFLGAPLSVRFGGWGRKGDVDEVGGRRFIRSWLSGWNGRRVHECKRRGVSTTRLWREHLSAGAYVDADLRDWRVYTQRSGVRVLILRAVLWVGDTHTHNFVVAACGRRRLGNVSLVGRARVRIVQCFLFVVLAVCVRLHFSHNFLRNRTDTT